MKIALEIIPAHATIDDGFSRWMYSVPNAVFERDTTHEFRVILGPDGNADLLHPNARTSIVKCPPRNQNINQQVAAARMAREWKADALHNFGAPPSMLWRGPLILTIHDAAIVTHPHLFPRRWVLFQKYVYAALRKKNPLVITVSEFSREEIALHLRFPIERIHVVHPIPMNTPRVIAESEKESIRRSFPLPEKFFLFVGILEPRKNLVRLMHAFAEYRRTGGDAELVIGGRIGWKAAEIVAAAKESPVAKHVHLIGYVPDEQLPPLISLAHAFVYPSLYEGFGIPPVEALMCDVPVLASNASCLPEILGDAALLVNPLQVESIADRLREIDGNTTLRHALIANGRIRRQRYSAEQTARGILNVYDLL